MSTVERILIRQPEGESTFRKPQPSPISPAERAERVQTATRANSGRLYFLDNLRWALTILVILHHFAITYGAEGDWYYVEEPTNMVASMALTVFVALNQGFFMGLFFLVAGYFVPASLDRKGTWQFLKDRIIRLGLPLLVYGFIIGPALNALVESYEQDGGFSFSSFWSGTVARWQILAYAPGPLWFVETLLVFSLVYVLGSALLRHLGNGQPDRTSMRLTNLGLIGLAAVIALAAFATRLAYPIGTEWTHLQLAYFPQYIVLFSVGILTYRNKWLPQLPSQLVRTWSIVAIVAILAMPVMMTLPGVDEDFSNVFGGWNFYSLLLCTWEAFYSLAMSIALLGLFQRRFNQGGAFSHLLSTNAYAVYIIHAPVLVTLSIALREVAIHPLLKFALFATPAVIITYALAYLLVERIPGVKRVL